MNGKVYKITNNVTGESYIGKTIRTIDERFKEHCHGTERDDGRRSQLQKAMARYGYENFSIELLMDGIETQERLDEVETGYMMVYGTMKEYNAKSSYNKKSSYRRKDKEIYQMREDFVFGVPNRINTKELNLLYCIMNSPNTEGVIKVNKTFLHEVFYNTKQFNSFFIDLAVSLENKIKNTSKESYLKVIEFNSIENTLCLTMSDDIVSQYKFLSNKKIKKDVLIGLSNKYSKLLYVLIVRNPREFNITTEALRISLGFPSSYSNNKCTKLLLCPSLEELMKYFPKLKIIQIKKDLYTFSH